MDSKDCRAEVGRSQKILSARILQVRQLSMMSSPYGESINSPRVTVRSTGLVGSIQAACSHTLQRLTGMVSDQTPVTRVAVTVSAGQLPIAVTSATTGCDDAHRQFRGFFWLCTTFQGILRNGRHAFPKGLQGR